MAAKFHMDIEEAEQLLKTIEGAGKKAESIINDILHTEAGQRIRSNIILLLPQSGRNWAGKRIAARKTEPFQEKNGNLSVTVTTKSNYHYLYFPDDGKNTVRHAGNQQFMYRGAENTAPDIVKMCTARIIKEF